MKPMADTNSLKAALQSGSAAAPPAWIDAPCADVTRLVASILDVPVALLSLPRAEEYRFRVNIGLDGFEAVPSRISFCAYTMLGTDLLVVPDARFDARFRHNPLVQGAPHIISYVGAPLISSRGTRLGTLCAIDHQPRMFDPAQLERLRAVSRIAAWLLEAEATEPGGKFPPESSGRQAEDSRMAERERLAIALHEGVAQDLFALRLQLHQLRNSRAWRPEGDSAAAEAGAEFTRALDRSIGDVCEIANELLPQGTSQLSIAEAIRLQAEEVARRTGLEIQVHESGGEAEIDPGTRLLLLRATREALASVGGRARACNVAVTFECGAQALRLQVVDDGAPTGADAHSHGMDHLFGLRDRASAVGGTLRVERNPLGGTTLTLQVPRAATHLR
jgi:signal transduction histidine kinase